jgi:hypothetical protein
VGPRTHLGGGGGEKQNKKKIVQLLEIDLWSPASGERQLSPLEFTMKIKIEQTRECDIY